MGKVQRASPLVRAHVRCYHHVSSKRNSTVVTYRGSTCFTYAVVEDRTELTRNWLEHDGTDSANAIGPSHPFVIESRLEWKVGDAPTRQALEALKKKLHTKHKDKDKMCEVTTSAKVECLVSRQIYVPDGQSITPKGGNSLIFFFCELFIPMFGSISFYLSTRRIATKLITHTAYKTIHVESSRQNM